MLDVDRAVLSVLPTDGLRDDLTDYIRGIGWSITSSGRGGEMWSSPHGRQVGIPYQLTVETPETVGVLTRIAADLGQSARDTALVLRGQWIDTFAFRASSDVYIRDTIPAKAGADLFQSVWRLLRAAATTSLTPTPQISGKWSAQGDEAIDNARFGQTERGSYILPLLVPLQRELGDTTDTLNIGGHYHEPPARRATRTLIDALDAVNRVIIQPESQPSSSAVADLVQFGVSRELITAVSSIVKHESVANLDIAVNWADRIEAPSKAPLHLTIPSDARTRLEMVAPRFKKTRMPKVETLKGPICLMEDRPGDTIGHASVETIRNGRQSRVDVILNREQLAQAHDWFKSHDTIIVQGQVESTPKGLLIRTPQRFNSLNESMIFGE